MEEDPNIFEGAALVGSPVGMVYWHIPRDVLELFSVESDGYRNIMSVRGLSGSSMRFTEKGMEKLKEALGGKLVSKQRGKASGQWTEHIIQGSEGNITYTLAQVDSAPNETDKGVWMTFLPKGRWTGSPGSYSSFVRSVIAEIVAARKRQRQMERDMAARVAVAKKLPFGPSLGKYLGGRKRTRRYKKRRMTRRR